MSDDATKKDAPETSAQKPAEKPASPPMDNDGWGNDPVATQQEPAANTAEPTKAPVEQPASDTPTEPAPTQSDTEPVAETAPGSENVPAEDVEKMQPPADTVEPAENAPDKEPSADTDADEAVAKNEQVAEAEGGDELVTSPEEPPETVAMSDNFARVEKGNFISTVAYYADGRYGEFVLEDISGLEQNGSILKCICRESGFVYELEVQPDEALTIFNKWRSIKAQRRNA